jgi:hypothetical protein
MLPADQIQTERGFADVYLIEARSIGGLSGSPVFARTTDNPDSPVRTKLLGLMHGHWDIKESEINKPSIIQDRQRGVNLGIGVVVPASKILETINQPALVEWRAIMEKKILKQSIPSTDSAKKRAENEQGSMTKDDFEQVLKKVTRKIEPPKK